MFDTTEQLDKTLLASLRRMARQGRSPSDMLRTLKQSLGEQTHIITLLKYFRHAFGLTLTDVKPIAALSRNEQRGVEDEPLLNQLLLPALQKRRTDWEILDP